MSEIINKVERLGTTRVWGKHTLTVGELIGVIIGGAMVYWGLKKGKRRYVYLGIGVIVLTEVLF